MPTGLIVEKYTTELIQHNKLYNEIWGILLLVFIFLARNFEPRGSYRNNFSQKSKLVFVSFNLKTNCVNHKIIKISMRWLFGVCIFPYLDWMWRFTGMITACSVETVEINGLEKNKWFLITWMLHFWWNLLPMVQLFFKTLYTKTQK